MKARTFAVLAIALGIYVFSIGPVMWFLDPEATTSLGKHYTLVRKVYYPLGQLPAPLLKGLDAYVEWWLNLKSHR